MLVCCLLDDLLNISCGVDARGNIPKPNSSNNLDVRALPRRIQQVHYCATPYVPMHCLPTSHKTTTASHVQNNYNWAHRPQELSGTKATSQSFEARPMTAFHSIRKRAGPSSQVCHFQQRTRECESASQDVAAFHQKCVPK